MSEWSGFQTNPFVTTSLTCSGEPEPASPLQHCRSDGLSLARHRPRHRPICRGSAGAGALPPCGRREAPPEPLQREDRRRATVSDPFPGVPLYSNFSNRAVLSTVQYYRTALSGVANLLLGGARPGKHGRRNFARCLELQSDQRRPWSSTSPRPSRGLLSHRFLPHAVPRVQKIPGARVKPRSS